ncbi:RER1 isoform X1, partial [Paramuricea clavata]
MADLAGTDGPAQPSFISRLFTFIRQRHQKFLDDVTPYMPIRWIVTLILFIVYTIRFLYLQ